MSVMGKEASLDGLEFDGETVLCRVCGDKASGFHYGVHACEGCKGFFRRSIQQKIQYRPCLKNQQCNIMRVNRNRCQYCRYVWANSADPDQTTPRLGSSLLAIPPASFVGITVWFKKCISVGMSRDAVRFGRVPKKEKARIIEQMQRVNLQSATTQMSSVLISTQDLVQSVIVAHKQTCDLYQEKVRMMRDIAMMKNDYVDCPAHMACPLNFNIGSEEMTDNQNWKDFSELFAPAIKSVVDFAKLIPGFMLLNQDDQVVLLKAATFEVLLVRMACLFDPTSSTMMFTNGKLFRRQTTGLSTSVGFLLDSMFDFAERFNKLALTDDELALFSAVVLLSPDRPGLRCIEQVEKIQNKLTESLQNMINLTHKEDSTLFAKLLMKTTDLRTLNALHSEKTVGQGEKTEDNMDHDSQLDARSEDSSPSDTSSVTMNSASGMDMSSFTDSNTSLHPHRFSGEIPTQQQVVLRTPYGTFYREDTGYYGMVSDQPPRRRCQTLDRDSVSRPRLHTIEEGSRRRNTMDREYINKMVSRLSDKLEKRSNPRGDSMPTSISNSATSSPIPEEFYSYLNPNREFIPISTPDSSGGNSRTSPSFMKDTLHPFYSSPNSPRPRSGSMGEGDIGPMRPRCSSFHMNSEGHAARSSHPYSIDLDLISPESQHYRMSAEVRRGSVGAVYGLHARKKSLLVDRHPAYLSRMPDPIFKKSDKQRSPLATETNPNNLERLGGTGSAFEQVPHLNIPAGSNWGPGMLNKDHPEPPVLSVTAPQEDCSTEPRPVTLSVPDTQGTREASPGGSGRNSPDLESKNEGEMFHKFDKWRKKYPGQHSDHDESKRMEGLTLNDKENESANSDVHMDTYESYTSNKETEKVEKPRKSAKEAHPQLLAQLKAAPQFKPAIHPAFGAVTQNLPVSDVNRRENRNNVVLTVPQTSFMNRISPSHSPSNPAKNQAIMEELMRGQETSPRKLEQYNANMQNREICPENHAHTVSHLKDKLMRKYDSTENLTSIGQGQGQLEGNQTYPQNFPNGQVAVGAMQQQYGQQFYQGYPLPVRMESAASVGPNVVMGMYPQMYMQAPGMPQYNQHLAGMQQLVYGNQQRRRSEGSETQPLNLTQTSGCSDANRLPELDRKIKEEVIS